MIELGIACFAVVIAAIALARSYVPPQTRKVMEVEQRVSDLEWGYEQISGRMTKRAREGGMEKAREAYTTRNKAADALAAEALAVLESNKRQAAEPAQLDPAAQRAAVKAALRAKAGIH